MCCHATLAKRFVQLHSWHIIMVDEQFIKLEMKMLHVLLLCLRPIDVQTRSLCAVAPSFSHQPQNFRQKVQLDEENSRFFPPICHRLTFTSMWCWWWRWSNCDEKFTYHSDLAWKFNAFFLSWTLDRREEGKNQKLSIFACASTLPYR